MTLTEPELKEPDVGSPDDRAHLARKEDIVRAAVEGGLVTALCGVRFAPLRDPEGFPVCETCKRLFGQLNNRSMS